jgi:hypothetical protein
MRQEPGAKETWPNSFYPKQVEITSSWGSGLPDPCSTRPQAVSAQSTTPHKFSFSCAALGNNFSAVKLEFLLSMYHLG